MLPQERLKNTDALPCHESEYLFLPPLLSGMTMAESINLTNAFEASLCYGLALFYQHYLLCLFFWDYCSLFYLDGFFSPDRRE